MILTFPICVYLRISMPDSNKTFFFLLIDIRKIVEIQIQALNNRLQDKRITLNVDADAKNWLSEHGYDPIYGARPLNRLIKSKILNPLSRLLIGNYFFLIIFLIIRVII